MGVKETVAFSAHGGLRYGILPRVPLLSVLGESVTDKSPPTPLFLREVGALPPFNKGGQGGFWGREAGPLKIRTRTRRTPSLSGVG